MWVPLLRTVLVSLCLLAVAFCLLPQLAALNGAEPVEVNCACHQQPESCGEHSGLWASARRRWEDRRRNADLRWLDLLARQTQPHGLLAGNISTTVRPHPDNGPSAHLRI
jgi:hypothetical protein